MVHQGDLYHWVAQGDLAKLQELSHAELFSTISAERPGPCDCALLLEGSLSLSRVHSPALPNLSLQFLAQLQLLENTVRAGRCRCDSDYAEDANLVVLSVMQVHPIHVAAFHVQPHVLRYLLSIGEDPNALTGTFQRTPLHMAAMRPFQSSANLECAMMLIQAGGSCNATDTKGDTPLHKAAAQGSPDLVQLLLDKGACLDSLNRSGSSPLFLAVMRGHLSVIQCLVKAGADPSTGGHSSPLVLAISRRDRELVRLLLSSSAQPDLDRLCMDTEDHAMTLLHCATCQGDAEIAEMLLDHGAAVDRPDQESNTALISTVFADDVVMARLLVSRGCNVNYANIHGYTALHHAAWEGQLDLLKVLLDAHAQQDLHTLDMNTPLSLACHGDHPEVVQYLLQHTQCDVNNADKDMDTPLHYTTYNGNEVCTQLLLSHNANPDVENSTRVTPLWNAVFMRNTAIVWQLLKANVRTNIPSVGIDQHAQSNEPVYIYQHPQTPLYVACDIGDFDTAKVLVLSGLDLTRERWLWNSDRIPLVMQQNPVFKDWIMMRMTHPPSLRHICRRSIRKLLGKSFPKVCDQLEIPVNLKDYLSLKYL